MPNHPISSVWSIYGIYDTIITRYTIENQNILLAIVVDVKMEKQRCYTNVSVNGTRNKV